jgi:hypothetical protein
VHTVSGPVVSVPAPPPPPSWTGYTPIGVVRAVATRSIAAHSTLTVPLAGHNGVPANATSVLVDVGVSGTKSATGAVMAEPHGGGVPRTGAVSWNTVTQPAVHSMALRLSGGAVDLYNSSAKSAPVYLDVLGYYAPTTGKLLSTVRPAYVLNTSQGVGQPAKAPLGAGKTVSVLVRGTAGVPANATSVVLNLATGGLGSNGGLTAWPHGATRPGLSVLMWAAHGDQATNLVTVPIGGDGRIDLYNSGSGGVDLVAFVAGYYATTTGRTFTPTTPHTILDTRSGIGRAGTSPLAAAGTVVLQVAGAGTVPSGATAVLVELGTVPATGAGSLTAWPDGAARPAPANLYWNIGGHLTTNLAIVPLPANGRLDLRDNGAKSVAVTGTVLGYWTG